MFDVCVGDGAAVCAGAAAGVCPERLRGRRGRADSQTDPQRSQGLESCEETTSLFLSVCVWSCVCSCFIVRTGTDFYSTECRYFLDSVYTHQSQPISSKRFLY